MNKIIFKKYYAMFHPVIWCVLGASLFAFGFNVDLPTSLDWQTLFLKTTDETAYKTPDGRFACWWIEDAMNEERFADNSIFVKDLFQVYLKHCEDLPRP